MTQPRINRFYTGIGNRDTPNVYLRVAEYLGESFADMGLCLRSGAAPGFDAAIEMGAKKGRGDSEIYLPWMGFERHPSRLFLNSPLAASLASDFHPGWDNLSEPVKRLMTRNSFQLLGQNLDSPSDFVVCYSKGGNLTGGTSQVLRMADFYDVPVWNLAMTHDPPPTLRFLNSVAVEMKDACRLR